MSTTKSTRRNVIVLVFLLTLVARSAVISVKTILQWRVAFKQLDEAARRSGSITEIIANETAPKGISLAQLDRLSTSAMEVEKVDDPPKVKVDLPEDSSIKEPQVLRFYFTTLILVSATNYSACKR
jgi:hypothetical protein